VVEQAGAKPRHLRVLLAQLAGPFRPWGEDSSESSKEIGQAIEETERVAW
jgi:hypothetical protein